MIIRNSFKQLLRKPGKAILFFVLMTASTLLLVFGAAMYTEALMRFDALDDIYSTIGTIRQPWEQVRYEPQDNACFTYGPKTVVDYGGIINPSELDFPGANYLVKPENRPYYLSYNPELNNEWRQYKFYRTETYDVLEFEPLEDSPDGSAVQARVTKVVYEGTENSERDPFGTETRLEFAPKAGDEITVCQHKEEWSTPLKKGRRYIGYFGTVYGGEQYGEAEINGRKYPTIFQDSETAPVEAPFTSLVDELGESLPSSLVPQWREGLPRIVEVTGEESYEPWLNMTKEHELRDYLYAVMPVTDPDMVACFRNNLVSVRGRMITDEEFETGARVCLIDQTTAQRNLLYDGDKIKLSLIASMYGYSPESTGSANRMFSFPEQCSLLDGEGNFLDSFWDAEYEIVGVFSTRTAVKELPFIPMIIIPSRSVQGSDQGHIVYYGPMNDIHTSFRIPNGTQEEFAKALSEAVPDSERLVITYDDMGYARAAESLEGSRNTAFLLLIVGVLSAIAIVALLLYFFVVKEKKRTAIERSLGRTRGQCRSSILAALLTLTFIAVGTGSAGAGFLLSRSQELSEAQSAGEEDNGADLAVVESASGSGYKSDWGLGGIYNFSGQYSPWAMWDIKGNRAELTEIEVPMGIYVGAPLVLWVLVGALAWVLVNRNLKIEPILLLGTRS